MFRGLEGSGFTLGHQSIERLKEEYYTNLQAQYHNLKLECEKLASEKIEIQRHYVMVSGLKELS